MQNLNYINFKRAAAITFAGALLLLTWSFLTGKDELFLLLNNDSGKAADYFFYVMTYGGDGIAWLAVLLVVVFLLKRKDVLPLLISSVVVSTVLVQGIKNLILPGQPRPTKEITDSSLVHVVSGVDIHSIGSFPSGHTTTSFCVYLIFCLLLRGNWWVVVGFIYALLVGYSRVYLAQHFPIDVAGGMIAAIISVYLSLKIQQKFVKRR